MAKSKNIDLEALTYYDGKIKNYVNTKVGTGGLTIDDSLSDTSENPVQNKVVNAALEKKVNTADLNSHTSNTSNPHSVTKSQVGLGNVPNVATNDQTPTFTEATSLTKLSSGEKLSVAFGKISKAITDLISHIGDSVKHITSTERTNWNAAKTHADSAHAPSDAQANVIESVKVNGTALTPNSKAVNITVPSVGNGTITITQNGTTKGTFTTNQSGNTTIALTDNNTTYGVATSSALGLVKSGTDITVDSSGNVSVNDDSHNHVISNIDGLQSALDSKAASTHTHDDRYYTESEVDTKLNGKANTSHGNHVPTTQTANNAVFLRNDNTWATVTPANIGAAASSHTHSSYVNQNAFSNVVVGSTTVAADSATDTLTLVAGSNVTITPDATNDKITISATDTNTHYTSKNVVGSSTATSNTTSALTNGNVYLNSVENGVVTSAHKISGSGATTVTTDANGNIIISSTDTNTNTTYTANTGIKLNGTTFQHTNAVTAGTAQGDASKTLTFGGTFTIPTVTYDAQGHITAKGTTTMTMPANPNSWRGIQNNLTSDSTTDSLSAAQGKVLKGLVDGKAAASHSHNYAGSSSAGGAATTALTCTGNSATATTASRVFNSELTYGINALQYFNIQSSATSGKVNAVPVADRWYHIIRMNHANNEGYFCDLAFPLDNTNDPAFRVMIAGNEGVPWRTFLTSGNYTSYTVTKTGSGASGTWGINITGSSASCSGNAASATALTTSAGSATQPVYFSGGKPVACSYTLGKSVPSDAVFTDTWRGVQDNLTSTATNQSLSANQGKVLKGLIDGKAAASHTHNYAGSSSAGGDATNALKLSGLSASTTATASTIVARDSNNYVNFSYINSNTSNSENPTISQIIVTNGSDHYYRKASLAHLKSSLGSMPASDVYAWAKASTKPTYTASEVGAAAASHSHNYAGSSSAGGAATTALTCTGNSATSSKLTSSSYTTISIATSDWATNSSGGYVCTKSLSSAMAYTNFNIDVVLSTDQSAAKLQIESWNNVIADGEITQTTSNGSTTAFTFYAFTTKPSVALTVGIQGVS